ncbi:MAG TPA: NAD(P)-binding domain-containing protein [Gemmataceae bacterium]|nr:NAD(P)-binding domain-containing protein [Gemmataceae bacterium]
MPKSDQSRIAILGAGPIGIEAALYARKLDLAVTVYERGRIAEYVQRWGHVRLFSPFAMNSTSLGRATIRAEKPKHEFPGDNDCTTGREHFRKYLEPLAASEPLKGVITTETQVMRVGRRGFLKGEAPGDAKRGRQPFRLLLRDKQGKERIEEADIVLDCTGTYGQHRWLGDGGIPALGELGAEQQISYQLDDILGDKQSTYSGKTVLVVGGGYSAATTVCNLAELSRKAVDTWVHWAARSSGSQPIRRIANDPLRERDRLAARANTLATRTDDSVEFHAATTIDAIETAGQDRGFKVTARQAGQTVIWNVDRIVANLGYTPDTNLCRELQIHECYASLGPMKLAATLLGQGGGDCLKLANSGPDTLRNPEPNFYILGAKSYGRNSHFLLRAGFEQVRDVFTLITGKANLDLYKGVKA